jgi:hypothetical protein
MKIVLALAMLLLIGAADCTENVTVTLEGFGDAFIGFLDEGIVPLITANQNGTYTFTPAASGACK